MGARTPLIRFAAIAIWIAAGLFFLHGALQIVGFLPSHDVPPLPELIRPSHVLTPQILHADPLIHSSFEAYDSAYTNVPAWIIRLSPASSPAPDSASASAPRRNATSKQGSSYRSLYRSTIHRFFDSSPFSPSGRYLAVTRLPAPQPSALLRGKVADVFIVDLVAGGETLVARSGAWGAQLGAQLQWGVTDSVLVFNQAATTSTTRTDIISGSGSGSGSGGRRGRVRGVPPAPASLHGVVYDLNTQTSRSLPCPVYHVSPDGRRSAAPNLLRVRYTQLGYGADYLHSSSAAGRRARRNTTTTSSTSTGTSTTSSTAAQSAHSTHGNHSLPLEGGPSTHASRRDGLYVSDLLTGRCTLWVSLYDLCRAAGLDTASTPTYGFHAKWSPDGSKVLFVVRTLERARGLAGWWGQRVRRQHLFVVAAVEGERRAVRHLVSWSSKEFAATAGARASGSGTGSGSGSGAGAGSGSWTGHEADGNHPSWVPGTSLISMNMRAEGRWQLVTYDASDSATATASASPSASAGATATVSDKVSARPVTDSGGTGEKAGGRVGATATRLFAPSSGHPNMSPGGRYALLDVYAKERHLFAPFAALPGPAASRHAPLRLVDTHTGREAWLLSLQLQPDPPAAGAAVAGLPPPLPAREARAWRCDMHPAWSRDHGWVALMARPAGRGREVVIAYLGGDLGRFFEDKGGC